MDTDEKKIYFAAILMIGFVTWILVFFTRTIIKHQKKLAASYKKQIQTEISTLEAERRRMAADLHDDLGPFLSSLKLQLNLLDVPEDDKPVVKNLNEGLGDIIQKVREISNGLLPNILVRDGVVAAIQVFSEKINYAKQLKVETHLELKQSPLAAEQEIHLFRIFQEALNNCIRHSGASLFTVALCIKKDKLVLEMKDNGKGMDMTVLHTAPGTGIKNILSRADILGGALYIDARPGKGVKYSVEIPLDKDKI